MSIPNFTQFIASDIRYGPAIVGALIFLVMLLFFDHLTEPLKLWFVPSLATYVIGAGYLGYVQAILYARRNGNLEGWQTGLIFTGHLAWFISFVAYNFYRGAL